MEPFWRSTKKTKALGQTKSNSKSISKASKTTGTKEPLPALAATEGREQEPAMCTDLGSLGHLCGQVHLPGLAI